ncbi:hypothetical protein SAMN04488125_1182 [Methylorubrum salsuginis]|uniref:Uncharacterized protein n=1 Tax=Methylorubrum salsuginis TaxID=414703 RepID=A0A1I4IPB6_9HYPH|nr:hypothetical protein SAMN04488125_1182 [Methylorubrum salsuginis]
MEIADGKPTVASMVKLPQGREEYELGLCKVRFLTRLCENVLIW